MARSRVAKGEKISSRVLSALPAHRCLSGARRHGRGVPRCLAVPQRVWKREPGLPSATSLRRPMLYLVGLGLGDHRDITVRGLEAVRSCDKVFLENYTSILGVDKAKLVRRRACRPPPRRHRAASRPHPESVPRAHTRGRGACAGGVLRAADCCRGPRASRVRRRDHSGGRQERRRRVAGRGRPLWVRGVAIGPLSRARPNRVSRGLSTAPPRTQTSSFARARTASAWRPSTMPAS